MSMEKKVDKILEEIVIIKVDLARHGVLHEKNAKELKEHIKRTNINEENLALLRQEHNMLKMEVEMAKTSGKTVKWVLATLGSLILGILSVLKTLSII